MNVFKSFVFDQIFLFLADQCGWPAFPSFRVVEASTSSSSCKASFPGNAARCSCLWMASVLQPLRRVFFLQRVTSVCSCGCAGLSARWNLLAGAGISPDGTGARRSTLCASKLVFLFRGDESWSPHRQQGGSVSNRAHSTGCPS